ncbi:MAG: hypothetical protein FVQ84_09700 [Planctomycetes bacterium]|nr:hypothetical protein [Planctomycetota bacterium]
MGRTFIQCVLNALFKERTLFKRKKEGNAIIEAKGQATTSDKAAKTVNAKSKANLKEKHKPETEEETEEKIRSCAVDIKNCIDLINNTGTPDKPKKSRGHAKVDDRKADKSAGNRKASGSRNSDKSTKRSKQGASPAEMVILLAKAEEKLSEAVVKAKEEDDKKKKERKKKPI